MYKSFQKQQKDFYSVWGRMSELYIKWAEYHDINGNMLMILYGLDVYGDMTQKTLCHHFGLPKQTVNNIIKALLKKEYIELLPGTNDKREKLVVMTQHGREYAKNLLAPLYDLEQQTMKLIGEERVFQMLEIANLYNTIFEMKMEGQKNE